MSLPLALKRYGYHDVKLQTHDAQGTQTQTRSLAYLHSDTRERGDWEEGRGPIFGFWDWNGSHETPKGIPRLQVAVSAGIESSMSPFVTGHYSPEELDFFEQHGMTTHFLAYQFHPAVKQHLGVDFDASKPDEMRAAVIAALKKSPMATPTKVNRPELAVFFGEPLLGPVSYMSLPEFYGDPPYQMTEAEQAAYQRFHEEFVIAASAIKREWPQAKCLFPWGISSFPIPFLRHSPEVTALMDGPAVHQVLFERPGDAVASGDLRLNFVAAQTRMAEDRKAVAETDHGGRGRTLVSVYAGAISPHSRKPTTASGANCC